MRTDKYYTPELSEFHVGFEFDIKHDSGFEKSIYSVSHVDLFNIENNIQLENVRVKHLDQSDIESFGFEFIIDRFMLGKDRDLAVWIIPQETIIGHTFISRIMIVDCRFYMHNIRFDGHIKNKSELAVLLKQLNVLV